MTYRQRLSATVDADLLKAARRAVSDGRAASVSAWVNDALRRRAEDDRRLKAMDSFIRDYEAEHGVITEEDIRNAERYFRSRTIRVRPRVPAAGAHGRRKRGAA
jgi:hypothetical protein